MGAIHKLYGGMSARSFSSDHISTEFIELFIDSTINIAYTRENSKKNGRNYFTARGEYYGRWHQYIG